MQMENRERKVPSTAFKPGQSGNPKGRPKKAFFIPDILKDLLAKPDSYDPDSKKTALQGICKKAIDQARGGDRDARNWISERTEGKVKDRIEHSGGFLVTRTVILPTKKSVGSPVEVDESQMPKKMTEEAK